MTGERTYAIDMRCSIVERSSGSWAVELMIENIPSYAEAQALSKWIRGFTNNSAGTRIPLEPGTQQ